PIERIEIGMATTMISHQRLKFIERRSGTERRQFSYAVHIPERRSGDERRKPRAKRHTRPSSN
ncbi:MAG: hypothetical protein QNJ61_07380, partial [Desulfobacterales bacterium]|nr:hypothetical protein [Desulfobacterales bacterium]